MRRLARIVILLALLAALVPVPVRGAPQAQQFVPGTVVALAGTPHIWIADAAGVLHWGGDTRALAGRAINWGSRLEVPLDQMRAYRRGDPWLSAGLLKMGDPIYLVKWETNEAQPRLLHIQSIADVELFGITGGNYGQFVLDQATWELRYGMTAGSLARAPLAGAVPTPTPVPVPTAVPVASGTGNDARLTDIVVGWGRDQSGFWLPYVQFRVTNTSSSPWSSLDGRVFFTAFFYLPATRETLGDSSRLAEALRGGFSTTMTLWGSRGYPASTAAEALPRVAAEITHGNQYVAGNARVVGTYYS